MSPDAAASNEHIITPPAPRHVSGRMEKRGGDTRDNPGFWVVALLFPCLAVLGQRKSDSHPGD